jgi:hypothetical protein
VPGTPDRATINVHLQHIKAIHAQLKAEYGWPCM